MKLRGVELGGGPRIAGVLAGAIRVPDARKAASDGADLLEVRVDTLEKKDPASVKRALERLRRSDAGGLPVILTVRSGREGGQGGLGDKARVELYQELMGYADLVDVELSSSRILKNVLNSARRHKTRVIISYHNFKSTPSPARLKETVGRAREAGADIVKLATYARNRAELKRLAGVLLETPGLVAIAMGEKGSCSRVFFPFLGSLLTFGSVRARTAPGQMTVKELRRELERYGC